jgi:hypothetical protein
MLIAPAPPFTATLGSAPNGFAGHLHTIGLMRQLVNARKCEPFIIQTACNIIYQTPQFDTDAECFALFEYVRDRIRYVRDVVGVETLADPVMTLRRMLGDCDDQSTLLATLLESVGYPTRFIMAGYQGSEFEHVYLQALIRDEWVSMDPTQPEQMGWEPPDATAYWIEKV